MKTTTIFSFLCLLLLLNSCVTTKINTSNKQDYSALKENKMNIIKTVNPSTSSLNFVIVNECLNP